MKTKFFSLLIIGGAISFAACQGTGDGTPGDGDTTAIESSPDNTRVDENTVDSTAGTASTLDENTREFVTECTSGGMMEVQLGQLAQQKAVNQKVKDFGAMMVRDHTKANDDLKNAVSGKMNVPTTLSDRHQRTINDLNEETGIKFDKDYIKTMIDAHETTINKLEKISKESKDPAVVSFANNTLPTVKEHLASAKAIRDELSTMKK